MILIKYWNEENFTAYTIWYIENITHSADPILTYLVNCDAFEKTWRKVRKFTYNVEAWTWHHVINLFSEYINLFYSMNSHFVYSLEIRFSLLFILSKPRNKDSRIKHNEELKPRFHILFMKITFVNRKQTCAAILR